MVPIQEYLGFLFVLLCVVKPLDSFLRDVAICDQISVSNDPPGTHDTGVPDVSLIRDRTRKAKHAGHPVHRHWIIVFWNLRRLCDGMREVEGDHSR